MPLSDKYKELTDAATAAGINDLAVREQDGVITLTGEIKKDELKKLMPLLQSLKPKKVDNKATIK